MIILVLIGLLDHLRNDPGEAIWRLRSSTAASRCCEWVQVGINAYFPHRNYWVRPHLSLWFLAACVVSL